MFNNNNVNFDDKSIDKVLKSEETLLSFNILS